MAISITNDNGDRIVIFDDGNTVCFDPTGEMVDMGTVRAILMFQRMAGPNKEKMALKNAHALGKALENIIVGISKNHNGEVLEVK